MPAQTVAVAAVNVVLEVDVDAATVAQQTVAAPVAARRHALNDEQTCSRQKKAEKTKKKLVKPKRNTSTLGFVAN